MRCLYALLLSLCCCSSYAMTIEQLQQEGHIKVSYKWSPNHNIVQYQPVMLEIEIATDRWFSRGTRIEDFEVANAVVYRKGNLSSNSSRQVKGVSWVVQLWTLVIYPQQAGVIKIPAIDVFVSSKTENNTELEGVITLPEHAIEVVEPKAMKGTVNWLATTELVVTQQFDGIKKSYQPGDAITHTIIMKVADMPAMMLPQLSTPDVPGLAIYAMQPTVDDYNNRGVLSGTRQQQFIYTVEGEGNYTLPAYTFYWWNLTSAEKETIALEPLTLLVEGPALNVMSSVTAVAGTLKTLNWPLLVSVLSTLLLLVWLFFLLPKQKLQLWFNRRRKNKLQQQNFLQAISQGNSEGAMQCLYAILAYSAKRSELTLDATFGVDPGCTEILSQLKKSAYGGGDTLSLSDAKQLLAFINKGAAKVWPWQQPIKLILNSTTIPLT